MVEFETIFQELGIKKTDHHFYFSLHEYNIKCVMFTGITEIFLFIFFLIELFDKQVVGSTVNQNNYLNKISFIHSHQNALLPM